jgi:hypothetical protein
MATWSREQTATHRLLTNNFNEERWKTAALKNAYALMGRRRFEYAAAFFLLADHLQDAVTVLHNQLGDTQLAIAVARVYGGDDSPILLDFLQDKILPQAAREGNRWLATWTFWMLNRRDNAVRCLVTPLSTLLSPPETPNFKSKSYLVDDPALVVLYKQLREKSLQTLRGATMVGMREEWDFVLHTARLYERMGCDLLALDLGKTSPYSFDLHLYKVLTRTSQNMGISHTSTTSKREKLPWQQPSTPQPNFPACLFARQPILHRLRLRSPQTTASSVVPCYRGPAYKRTS